MDWSDSAAARNKTPYKSRLFCKARAASASGSVKTTWKYSTGSSSDWRFLSHLALASDWHLGQWRLRVVSDALLTATITFFDVAAKRGGATTLNSG
jgi:hypothetical protein